MAEPEPAKNFGKPAITCEECDETNLVTEFTRRADGTLECPTCGAPAGNDTGDKGAPKLVDKPPPGVSTPKYTGTKCSVCGLPQVSTPSGDTCAKAHGGAAPLRDGALTEEQEQAMASSANVDVNDGPPAEPAHAPEVKDFSAIAPGHEYGGPKASVPPSLSAPVERMSPPMPLGAGYQEHTAPGFEIRVSWGESLFPMERQYSNFRVGPFSLTASVHTVDELPAAAARLRAIMKQIADDTFEEQRAWYASKLGSL